MLLEIDRERVREEKARIDRERLQGRWVALSGQRADQMHVEDDQFTLTFRNGDVYSGTLTLDPTQRPRAWTSRSTRGRRTTSTSPRRPSTSSTANT